MPLTKAKLKQHDVEGTPIGIREEIPLGTEYLLDLNTVKWRIAGDLRYPDQKWRIRTVLGYRVGQTAEDQGWLPLDIFEVEGAVN